MTPRPLALLGVWLWTVVSCSPSLAWPFGRDQGIYAYSAWQWLQGAALYQDVYVFKPPGTVWLHGLAQWLFGANMVAIRVLDLGIQAFAAVGLAWLVAWWSRSERLGLWAGLLYGPAFYCFGVWATAQTDGWFTAFAVAALVCSTQAGEGRRPVLFSALAGLLLGVAMVFKYTALALMLPVLVPLVVAIRARQIPVASAAVLLAVLPVPLVLTWARMGAIGTWDDYLLCQGMVADYVRHTRPGYGLEVVPEIVMIPGGAIARLGILGAVFFLSRWTEGDARQRQGIVLWMAWTVAALASLMAQGRYYGYQFLPLLGPLSWSAAVLVWPLVEWVEAKRPRASWALGLLAVLVALPPIHWRNALDAVQDRRAMLLGWTDIESATRISYLLTVAEAVARETGPDDPVYVWSYDPSVMFLAKRRQVSRFLYNFPMVVSWQDGGARAELLEALEAEPPVVFVVSSGDAQEHVTDNPMDSMASFDDFEGLSRWVGAHYDRLADGEGFRIYRRRDR